MRITLTRLERFHHVADIRRLLSGIIVTFGLVVVLVQCFGIPCPKAFCLSPPVKVSVIVLTNSNDTVVKTEMNSINLSDNDDGKGQIKKDNDVLTNSNDTKVSVVKTEMNYINLSDDNEKGQIKKDKVEEFNVSVIGRPNVSLENPKMAVDRSESDSSSVLVRSKDSRKGNVLSMRHKGGGAVSISQMNSLLIQSLSSLHSPVRILILEFLILGFKKL